MLAQAVFLYSIIQYHLISGLVRDNILAVRNNDLWQAAIKEEKEHRVNLSRIAENYDEIAQFLDDKEL